MIERITIDFSWEGSFKRNELILKVLIKDYKTLNEVYTAVIDEDAEYITINDLRNGTDYLELEARCRHSGAAAALSHQAVQGRFSSPERLLIIFILKTILTTHRAVLPPVRP